MRIMIIVARLKIIMMLVTMMITIMLVNNDDIDNVDEDHYTYVGDSNGDKDDTDDVRDNDDGDEIYDEDNNYRYGC